MPSKGTLVIKGILSAVAVAIAAALVIVMISSSHRADRERSAATALRTLSSAEADFRANDRDWNHVNDFWKADVKGLFTMTSAAVPGAVAGSTADPSIKLIELSLAAADADESFMTAGGENLPLSAYTNHAVREGYWYAALINDFTAKGTSEATYKVDTRGNPLMGSCHNTSKFGFLTFPDSLSEGRFAFVINENNTVFRHPLEESIRLGNRIPPGLNGVPADYLNWQDLDWWEEKYPKKK